MLTWYVFIGTPARPPPHENPGYAPLLRGSAFGSRVVGWIGQDVVERTGRRCGRLGLFVVVRSADGCRRSRLYTARTNDQSGWINSPACGRTDGRSDARRTATKRSPRPLLMVPAAAGAGRPRNRQQFVACTRVILLPVGYYSTDVYWLSDAAGAVYFKRDRWGESVEVRGVEECLQLSSESEQWSLSACNSGGSA